VNSFLLAFDSMIGVLRVALFAVAAAAAVLAGLSYAVRTRRINPVSPVARLTRDSVDPLFAPVERRVVRFGGRPANAPWFALGAIVVGGIVVIGALGFVRQQIAMAGAAADMGPRGLARLLVAWTFGVLQLALLARVVSSWFRLSPYSPWVRWAFSLTEWLLRPLRNVIPPLGMIDVTPIVAYLLLSLLQGLVMGMI